MTPDSLPPSEVLVVGAGLAGLACARHLLDAGVDVQVVDAADAVGGRIRTDEVDGFLLDRGFQVLLTAYSEPRALVELGDLALQPFAPGSLIRWEGETHRLVDPWRDPLGGMASAFSPVVPMGDKLKVASLRSELLGTEPDVCLEDDGRTTLEYLRQRGFGDAIVERFFRPFLGGVFLDRELATAAGVFRYLFRCFSEGDTALPARGMQALPEAVARPLGERVRLGVRVESVGADGVVLEGGARATAERVVVATDGADAVALLGGDAVPHHHTVTTYFAAPEAPVQDALLVLDGDGRGPVNHLAVLNRVAPTYAPQGRHLVAASGVGPAADDADAFPGLAVAQLREWFGDGVDRWELLRTYRIPRALPRTPPGELGRRPSAIRRDGVVVAGDWLAFGSIQGALASGRAAAEAVLGGDGGGSGR